jgi:hypothetical protein
MCYYVASFLLGLKIMFYLLMKHVQNMEVTQFHLLNFINIETKQLWALPHKNQFWVSSFWKLRGKSLMTVRSVRLRLPHWLFVLQILITDLVASLIWLSKMLIELCRWPDYTTTSKTDKFIDLTLLLIFNWF